MARNLQDRTIVIVGGSSGIGAATARACAAAGMNVMLAARREDRMREVAADIEKLGRRVVTSACDVTKDEDIKRLFTEADAAFPRLDAVFANAGYGMYGSVEQTPIEAVRDIFEVNFYGTLRVLYEAIPRMRKQGGGHLLICSSAASEVGLPMYGAYAATKAAQDSIAGALRAEVYEDKIDVSSVHPIGTSSEFFDRVMRDSDDPRARPNTPSGMVQTPEKVAAAIVKALRKPVPEVWPHIGARLGLAIVSAFPRLGVKPLHKQYKELTDEHNPARKGPGK